MWGLLPNDRIRVIDSAEVSESDYESLLKMFLDSPHFGERWARHWLDVVRFGESQGFERDRLRPNAWPYRDWVVDSFNEDIPYNEFVADQIAGDVLKPHDPRGTIATGFLTAGPWDEVGQTQQSEAMKLNVRQDELEDVVSAVSQTFLGMTVNCARCHDHKFDPITQSDYYAITALLAGVHHGERSSDREQISPAVLRAQELLRQQIHDLQAKLDTMESPARNKILASRAAVALPRPILHWDFDSASGDAEVATSLQLHEGAEIRDGRLVLDGKSAYASTGTIPIDLHAKTLSVRLRLTRLEQRGGAAISIQSPDGNTFDALVYGEQEPGAWNAGSEFFSRTQSFGVAGRGIPASTLPDDRLRVAVVFPADGRVACYVNGALWGTPYQVANTAKFESGAWQVLFGLRHSPAGTGKHLAAEIDEATIFDRALSAEEMAALHLSASPVQETEIVAELTQAEISARNALVLEKSRMETKERLLAGLTTYAIAPEPPLQTYFLARGQTTARKGVVGPAGLSTLRAADIDIQLSDSSTDSERRIALAHWLTSDKNPLTARVIVNRLWHYHFGVGLVESPNDFGFNGGRPSHPKLLDWLACELIAPQQISPYQRPWSLKHIHWLMATSATYRQASDPRTEGLAKDADNRLLWRMSPRRLDAESLRDAVLAVSGQLNPRMGGPGYQEFTTYVDNSQFYNMIDPIGPEYQRRTLYRTWVRSARSDFLDAFDCPDPSATAPRRATSTTPQQALALLNNAFVLRGASAWAARLKSSSDQDAVKSLYITAYSRPPTSDELAQATDFVRTHGLAALCRVVLNSNEFLYIY